MPSSLPPFALIFVGGLLVAVTRGHLRRTLLLLVPVIGAANLMGIDEGTSWQVTLLGYTLTPFEVDRLSLLFGYLFHLALFIGNLFALHLEDAEDRAALQHTTAMLYAGSALGAVFAGDMISLFVFWELLALTSVFLIWARDQERSYRAGFRYLVIHVLSGVLLLSGALMRVHQTGSLDFEHIGLDGSLTGWVILLSRTPTPRARPRARSSSAPSRPRWRSTPWHAATPGRSSWSTWAPS
jgi:multicomponent Na+:H+ antiporter subunit D